MPGHLVYLSFASSDNKTAGGIIKPGFPLSPFSFHPAMFLLPTIFVAPCTVAFYTVGFYFRKHAAGLLPFHRGSGGIALLFPTHLWILVVRLIVHTPGIPPFPV